VVEQRVQSTRVTLVERRPEPICNEAVTGPSRTGRVNRQVSPHRVPAGADLLTSGVIPPPDLTRTPWNCPASFVPATGARRARRFHQNVEVAAAVPPAVIAATTSPTANVLVPALLLLIMSPPP
jgi:hypothetical protein